MNRVAVQTVTIPGGIGTATDAEGQQLMSIVQAFRSRELRGRHSVPRRKPTGTYRRGVPAPQLSAAADRTTTVGFDVGSSLAVTGARLFITPSRPQSGLPDNHPPSAWPRYSFRGLSSYLLTTATSTRQLRRRDYGPIDADLRLGLQWPRFDADGPDLLWMMI